MRIGIDFDNTIVRYDTLFHSVAIEQALIPPGVPVNKVAVRDHLRVAGLEDRWTELQGYVYGARMDEAVVYNGVIAFSECARALGHELFIISHKTRHPFLGPKYDLHAAAQSWIEKYLTSKNQPLVPRDRIFFELTKGEKLARIASCNCDLYIDDLPEILLAPDFPKGTSRLLFDPERHYPEVSAEGLLSFSDWAAVNSHVNGVREGARRA